MTGPALYDGQVVHTRPAGARYLFRHRMYMWLVDLDRPVHMPPPLRPFAGIRPRDHLGNPDRSIRENVDAYLADNGIDLEAGRILMLTNARVLGYVFNPLTVYWCHGPDDELRCIVAEVHNTHGELHCYLLHPGERGRCEVSKEFYVSPFLTVDGRYRMAFSEPGERLSVQMELRQDGARVFAASLTGRRLPLTARNLARMAVRHPLMPQRVTGLIHLHGVRLHLRRVPHVRWRRQEAA